MMIIRSIKPMAQISMQQHLLRHKIGFVPTMGALHQGHLSLIRRARKENDIVVVSIFVNPVQFGHREDLRQYPRPFKNDLLLCQREKVDFVLHPDSLQMYPQGYKTYIKVEELSDVLCGKPRPGHFRGVATVVAKLFNIVSPDIAYFGQKDAQQAIIIKKMAEDLNFPVKIKVMPIVREKSGLALSSRNIYLSSKEKEDALVLYQALNSAGDLIKSGERSSSKIITHMRQLIQSKKSAKIDYISITDRDALKPVEKIPGRCLISLAVWIGRTRLIDNVCLN